MLRFSRAAVFLLTLAAASPAWPAKVVLEWDPNLEQDLAGYRLFQAQHSLLGVSVDHAMLDAGVQKILIADPAATSTTVSGLAARTLYFFRLTALDAAGSQSDFNLDDSGHPSEVLVYLGDDHEGRTPQKFLSPGLRDGINDEAVFGEQAAAITVLDLRGRILYRASRAEGDPSLTWPGTDQQGRAAPSGVYVVRIRTWSGAIEYQSLAVAR